jgi:adenylyltransferase/sulfurtransferase
MYKAESAAQALLRCVCLLLVCLPALYNSRVRLNSHLIVDVITKALTAENAKSLLEPYDIILDCTDNAPTRYLISDTAVALKRPLVSGAALKYEGQLCVYNFGKDGPCYRCLYPKPPAPETMGSCGESGILGAVTGVIGNLQALETIKLITGLQGIYSKHQSRVFLIPFFLYQSIRPLCFSFRRLGHHLSGVSSFDHASRRV